MSEIIREVEVKFDYPVMVKGEEVDCVVVRKPRVKDELNSSKVSSDTLEQEVWLISALTNTPVSDIENLDSDQYELILVALGNLKRSTKRE